MAGLGGVCTCGLPEMLVVLVLCTSRSRSRSKELMIIQILIYSLQPRVLWLYVKCDPFVAIFVGACLAAARHLARYS